MQRTWRRLAAALGGLAMAITPSAPAGAQEPVPLVAEPPTRCDGPESCVVDVDVPVPDGLIVPGDERRPGNRVRIVLPPGGASSGRPLVFLLHGAGDGSETWTENTDVEELVAELCRGDVDSCPVVVMPDGGGKHSETGWYTDWYDGSRHWESYHIDVVLPWVRRHLGVGTCRGSTMVAGLSMGGFGAFSYAGRHPDLFVAAASFSGFLDTRPAPPLSTIGFRLAQEQGLGAPTEEMFGPAGLPVEEDGWAAHNPTDLARAGAYDTYGGNLWLATGSGTVAGPAGDSPENPQSYAVEAFIFELNQNFRVAMAGAGSTFRDHSYVGGNHSWPYWQRALRAALPEMLEVVEPCPTGASPPTATPMTPATPGPQAEPASPSTLPATGGGIPTAATAALAVLGVALRRRGRLLR